MTAEQKKSMAKLLSVQSKIGAIKKEKSNPYFNSSYFDINNLLDALKPVLNDEGLVLAQPLTQLEGKPALKTILTDPANGEVVHDYTVPLPEISDPQKFGSAVTYMRRYCLQSLFALEAEDDDGNKASTQARQQDMEPQYHEPVQEQYSAPVPTEMPTQTPDGNGCPDCQGPMRYQEGTTKTGKPYRAWFCKADRSHSPIWL